LILTLLCRLIVIWHHYQEGIHAIRLEHLHAPDGVLQRVGAAAGNHRSALRMRLGYLEHLYTLLVLKTRSLACSSKRHEEIYSSLNLTVDQRCKRLIVHLTVLERGDERGSAACKINLIH